MVATNKTVLVAQEDAAPVVVALKSKKTDKSKQSRVELFSIDGKSYGILTSLRPNQALQILHVMRKQGERAGVSFMLETLLGPDGYEALINFDDLETDDLDKIIKIGFEIVAGAAKNPKAK